MDLLGHCLIAASTIGTWSTHYSLLWLTLLPKYHEIFLESRLFGGGKELLEAFVLQAMYKVLLLTSLQIETPGLSAFQEEPVLLRMSSIPCATCFAVIEQSGIASGHLVDKSI